PAQTPAGPFSSTRPYMFTCPRPGIQIGNCMRSTPGATSVTSSDAGSCSCFGGLCPACPACEGWSVTRSTLLVRHGGELGPGAVGLRDKPARERQLVLVTTGHHLQPDGQALRGQTGGNAHR